MMRSNTNTMAHLMSSVPYAFTLWAAALLSGCSDSTPDGVSTEPAPTETSIREIDASPTAANPNLDLPAEHNPLATRESSTERLQGTDSVVDLNPANQVTLLLDASASAAKLDRLSAALAAMPGVEQVQADASKHSITVVFDPDLQSRALIQTAATKVEPGVSGVNYRFLLPADAHATGCGTHGFELFNQVSATSGVVKVRRFLGGDLEVDILADAERVSSSQIYSLLEQAN